MRGKPSDSERPWHSLALREEGGVAGLRRGCSLQREGLDPLQRDLVDALVAQLPQPAAAPAPVPDAQQLLIELETGGDRCTLAFDRAELPEAVQALLALVRRVAPWKPLPFE